MMRGYLSSLVLLGLLLSSSVGPMPAARAEFPLRDGDLWVMAGDSITAQHQHSNYFEAFCFARYPQLKFGFRNSGVGGHTIPSTLARFDYDVAGWKPTVISVELGMNDQGGTPTDKFVANMRTMLERIGSVDARPVILTASPVNDGTLPDQKGSRNTRLAEYAVALKQLAEEKKLPFADQFHPLVVIWAKNKPQETLFNVKRDMQTLLAVDGLVGKSHLEAFLAEQAKQPQPVSMQGDPVHPGPNGQLMMAAELLKGLGAEPFVSSASLDASGKLIEAKGCQVTDVKRDGDTLAFSRLDESLPFPIPDGTLEAVPLDPTIEALSLYLLKVEGLKPGAYAIKLNGIPLAPTFTAEALATGVNLTAAVHAPPVGNAKLNPLLAQTRAIYSGIQAKGSLVGQYRGLAKQSFDAKTDNSARLAELAKLTLEADAKIHAAAQPTKLAVEISPAK